MDKLHTYQVRVSWTGNLGPGTRYCEEYSRSHAIAANGKEIISGSSDPSFNGHPERWNPEELLVASISACHKLWYLHLCSKNDIVVMTYEDNATGVMREKAGGGGHFDRVVLHPKVTLAVGSDLSLAKSLHEAASRKCFIRNSVNFPVDHEAEITFASGPA